MNAALKESKSFKYVTSTKTAAIGFCFGGTSALELARSGTDILGVVSLHGALENPTPENTKNIKSKVMVLHGNDDPYVPVAEVEKFRSEMKDAKTDLQFISYSQAVHSFTNPAAGNDNSKGAAYNESADKRSWITMRQFFNEIF